MQQAYLPFNEAQRLKALQDCCILDSAPDERFEKLTRAVADAFGVPIAVVTLVDENRVWSKAATGLPFPKFREAPRSASFGAHVILTPGQPLVVEDASRDPRFADSPFVVGPPFIRFFAGVAINDEQGLPLGVLSIMDHTPRSLSEHEREELIRFGHQADLLMMLHDSMRKLGTVANRDGLTGLGNRRHFTAMLDELVATGTCALLSIDLEAFKTINDNYGLIAGDATLCEAARRIVAVAEPGHVVARLGADEFGVLIPGPFERDEPETVARRIVETLEQPFFHSGNRIALGACVGIALCPDDAGASNTLVRQAELALEAVQQGGRKKYGRPEVGEDGTGGPRRSLEWDLMRATEQNGFELHWQPIVDLRTDSLHGYEAFIRWNRPGLGEVPPERFLPAAERSGLVTQIDAWALRDACSQAAKWRDRTNLAVNVSADWLGSHKLPEVVSKILGDTGIEPSRLEIDITEGLLNRDAGQAARDIKALKDMGVRIALDDFGMGFSSLSYLKDFPFDMVKLHRTFTQDLQSNPRAAAVAEAVITLGRTLGIVVSAEGVEELWHLEFLRQRGCDLAQGYLFGRPSLQPREPGLPRRSLPAGDPSALERSAA